MSETKEPWEVEQFKRKSTTEKNEIANNPLEEKKEQGTLRELEGCKDMNQEFNGQDRIRNHSG